MTSLEEKIGYHFKRSELLTQALTHASFGFERNMEHNERLEFLGDSILGYLVAHKLFVAHPDTREGDLSKQKSAIVSAKMLAKKARQIGLGEHIQLGTGERRSQGAMKPSILADAMEGLIAAITLDGGMSAASAFIDHLFDDEINDQKLDLKEQQDFKTELQERLQARAVPLPEYHLLEEAGPAHDRRYHIAVIIMGQSCASAWGTSKKNAQQAAARQALENAEFWLNFPANPN